MNLSEADVSASISWSVLYYNTFKEVELIFAKNIAYKIVI